MLQKKRDGAQRNCINCKTKTKEVCEFYKKKFVDFLDLMKFEICVGD